jgi:hypothetical protein
LEKTARTRICMIVLDAVRTIYSDIDIHIVLLLLVIA